MVDQFQSLMNPGRHIPSFITELTGISNAMVRQAPSVAQVMADAARFVGETPLVAHNASFDRKFWQAELSTLGLPNAQPFACTVLLSRRLYPEAPNHKLGTLATHLHLVREGRAHRALSDVLVTAELLGRIQADLLDRHHLPDAGHAVLCQLQQCSRAAVSTGSSVRQGPGNPGGASFPPLPCLKLGHSRIFLCRASTYAHSCRLIHKLVHPHWGRIPISLPSFLPSSLPPFRSPSIANPGKR